MARFVPNFCKKLLNASKLKNTPSPRNLALFRKKKKIINPQLSNYVFVHPERDEFNKVYKLMEDCFLPDETTIRSLDAGFQYNPVFEKEIYETLEFGYSYIAKCKWTGCIVGACLNFATSEGYAKILRDYACQIKDEDTRNILLFYAYVQEAPELFEKYCENQCFVIRAVAVDRDNRNLKLATELIRLSRNLGVDLGFPLVRCDSSNYAISKICETLGMEWEWEMKYCEYLDKGGMVVFDPPPPNLSVTTYIDLPLRLQTQKDQW